MSAAYELRKTGADITILEASEDRIGGRVYTYYLDPDMKYYGEFGALRIPVSHETTWHYINLLKLDTISMTSPVRNNFLYVHNTRLRVTDSVEYYLYPKYDLTSWERNTPWSELNQYATTHIINQLDPQQRAELLRIQPYYSEEVLRLMNLSVREALESLGLSQGAISLISGVNSTIGATMDSSYIEPLNVEYTMDFRNLYHINGGNVNLPLAFYKTFIEPNSSNYYDIPTSLLGTVTFLPGHFVDGIFQSDHDQRVHLRTKVGNTQQTMIYTYDFVVCTIPFSVLRCVEIKPYFNNQKMQAILEYNYIDAEKTNFLCNHRFWEANAPYGNIVGGISFTDLPIQSIFYPFDHIV